MTEESEPRKQLEVEKGGAGRKTKTAVGMSDGGDAGDRGPGGSEPSGAPELPFSGNRVRAVICERDETICKALKLAVESIADIVGEASDGMAAVEIVLKVKPDLLLIDVNLDIINGVEVIRKIQQLLTDLKILVLTDSYHATKYFNQLFRAGANGIWLKHKGYKELRNAVLEVLSGAESVDPDIKALVRQNPSPSGQLDLTQSEVDVLVRLDLRNKEIAQELNMTIRHVERHVDALLRKLKVPTRTGAALKAIQLGFVLLPKMDRAEEQNRGG